jgi:peptidyl-prolyl cis-trans isomerase SurA
MMSMRTLIKYLFLLLPLLVHAAQPLDKVLAVVNEDVITESEVKQQMAVLKNQILAKNMQVPDDKTLRKQVLQHLIDVNIQLQLAKTNGVTIDSAELNNAIGKIADQNHITMTQLREEVVKHGMSWNEYRENIKKEMLISRVQQKAVGKDVVVTPQQVDEYLKTYIKNNKKQNQTYQIQNIVVPLPEEPTSEQVKNAQARAQELLKKINKGADFSQLALAESSGEYALEGGDLGMRHLAELPEVFANTVVDMHVGQVVGPIRAGNGFQLIKLVAVSGADTPHKVVKSHVRHILIKPEVGMTEEESINQVNHLCTQLKSGKDFSKMAKQYSVDAASAVKGGDLGWVTGEELVPAFAKAMSSLPLHTISKPVKTRFGWHIIEVLERKDVDDSQAHQRQEVMQFLQQRKFAEVVQTWQQHIRTDAYINIVDKDLA